MMNTVGIFLLLASCAVCYGSLIVFRAADSNDKWVRGSGLDLATLSFVIAFALRQVVAYTHFNTTAFNHLGTLYWGLYFTEHVLEAMVWTTLAIVVQLRRGKRAMEHAEVIPTLVTLLLALIGLALLSLFALFLAASLDQAVQVLRQLSLVLTVTLAVVEYTALWVKSALFSNPLNVLTAVETKFILLAPSTTLILGVAVCGVPKFGEPVACTVLELLHVVSLTATVVATWYLIRTRNQQCRNSGDPQCPSRIRHRHRHSIISWGPREVDIPNMEL